MSKLHKKQTLQRTKMAIHPNNMKIYFKRGEGLHIPKGVNKHKEKPISHYSVFFAEKEGLHIPKQGK